MAKQAHKVRNDAQTGAVLENYVKYRQKSFLITVVLSNGKSLSS